MATKEELVKANEKLEMDKELLRDENARLTGKLAAIRAIMDS